MFSDRNFLLLQGPHGPFFSELGRQLRSLGCGVTRVGFNAGDQVFWRHKKSYVPFHGTLQDWPKAVEDLLRSREITDIVLYGDTRPIHAKAIEQARKASVRIHIFEEGYMRPYWVTYERDGSNGNSRLMTTSLSEMQEILQHSAVEAPEIPAVWGQISHHAFYGTLYHLTLLLRRRAYPNFCSHRRMPLETEFRNSLRAFVTMPLQRIRRRRRTRAIKQAGVPYHLVLMQLEHDASFLDHSPFPNAKAFLEEVIAGFAKGAPLHHLLVFKAHPMDTSHPANAENLRQLAHEYGVEGRVQYVPGGKLAQILDYARTAITVNSTSAQQVLWRGLPLKIFGDAVYAKPEFVSDQPLADFFATPKMPDRNAYRYYRRYLLETSQIVGGFYSHEGRRLLLRQVIDMMLQEQDPYQALAAGAPPKSRHLWPVPKIANKF